MGRVAEEPAGLGTTLSGRGLVKMNQLPVLIVTGGTRGIGAATAKLAAARGYAVCINYQHGRGAAEQLVRDITNRHGQAITVQADISSEPSVLALYEQVDSTLGRISALVNN